MTDEKFELLSSELRHAAATWFSNVMIIKLETLLKETARLRKARETVAVQCRNCGTVLAVPIGRKESPR